MTLLIKILRLSPISTDEKKLKICLKILGINFMFLAIFTILKLVAQEFELYAHYKHPTSQNLEQTESYLAVLTILFLSVIVHPLTEELSFRFWITKRKWKFYVGIAMAFTLIFLVYTKIHRFIPITGEVAFHLLFICMSSIIALVLLRLYLVKSLNFSIHMLTLISSLLFSLLHLNVIGAQNNIIGYLIILVPYFISGYLYSYIAYRVVFFYSFFTHALHNLIIFVLGLWISSF